MRIHTSMILAILAMAAAATPSQAQDPDTSRTVGRKGAVQMGLSFSSTTFTATNGSGESDTMTSLFGIAEVGRFVTERIVVRSSFSGFGQVGGGRNSTSFLLGGGGLVYFTPQKPSSVYVGGDMLVPVSSQGTSNALVFGRFGVQSAFRQNAMFFVEGGYGGIARSLGSAGQLSSNVGFRFLF